MLFSRGYPVPSMGTYQPRVHRKLPSASYRRTSYQNLTRIQTSDRTISPLLAFENKRKPSAPRFINSLLLPKPNFSSPTSSPELFFLPILESLPSSRRPLMNPPTRHLPIALLPPKPSISSIRKIAISSLRAIPTWSTTSSRLTSRTVPSFTE